MFFAKIEVVSLEDPVGGSPESPDSSPQIVEPLEVPAAVAETSPVVAPLDPVVAPVDVDKDRDVERPRSTLAEWTITNLLLLFLTTTLVQAYVIPTGSMEDTLLIGDHLLVDKLSFAPAGPVSKYILPYTDVMRGDIIVFRYPVDISQTFVKRCIGVPGDQAKKRALPSS